MPSKNLKLHNMFDVTKKKNAFESSVVSPDLYKVTVKIFKRKTNGIFYYILLQCVHYQLEYLLFISYMPENIQQNILGSPNPKKWLSFGFVGIFEYIILPMLIIFLGMCPNSYGWMPSL